MERENVLNLLGEYSSVRVIVINNDDVDYKFVIDIVWFEDFDNEIVIYGDNNSHIVLNGNPKYDEELDEYKFNKGEICTCISFDIKDKINA